MNPHINSIENDIQSIVDNRLTDELFSGLTKFEKALDKFTSLFDAYNSSIQKIEDKSNTLQISLETLKLKENIFDLVSKNENLPDLNSFEEVFNPFLNEIEKFISKFPEYYTEVQDPERFQQKESLTIPVKIGMFFKRISWQVGTIPKRFYNLFRKDKIQIKYWKHKIPIQNMINAHFGNEFIHDVFPLISYSNKIISEKLIGISEICSEADQEFVQAPRNEEIVEEDLEEKTEEAKFAKNEIVIAHEGQEVETIIEDIEIKDKQERYSVRLKLIYYEARLAEIRKTIAELKVGLKTKLQKLVHKNGEIFRTNIKKVGTIELPGRHYNSSGINYRNVDLRQAYQLLVKRWNNSSRIIQDTWLYKLELKIIRYFAAKEYFRLERTFQQRVNRNIVSELEKLDEFIHASKARIENFEGSEDELKKVLLGEKLVVSKDLTNNLIPRTVDFILNQELPNLIHQSEISLRKRCDATAEKRQIYTSEEIKLPLSNSVTQQIIPRGLIRFNALPEFSNSSRDIKIAIFEGLDNIQRFISEINQIVDFTLESSLASVRDTNENDQNTKEIAVQGLDRAITRTKDVYQVLNVLFKEVGENLRSKVSQFNMELSELMDLNNITALRNNINARVALERSQKARKDLINYFKNIIPVCIAWTTTKVKEVTSLIDQIKDRFGLAPAPEVISTEVADYLSATNSAIDKLPFVYQRLFKLEPIASENFYTPREEELALATKAFDKWKIGKYAPSVITGERGSGVTTFLLHFLESIKGRAKVIKGEVNRIKYTEEALLDFLSQLLDGPKFKNADEICVFLNKLEEPVVIVLENLQHLFLKTVDGFDSLKLLFELFSRTNKKVFWLTTCTIQAWDYLVKTLNIPDYFAYIIQMESFSNEEIIETIMRRHRVSGYNVIFSPSAKVAKSKKFKKVNEGDHQSFLLNEYFIGLCNFANSNLSLGILYWLMSTKSVEGNTIEIEIDEMDFNFLNSMPIEKLFTVYEIMLHSGLTEENLAIIQNKSVEDTSLMLLSLTDDGIIVKNNEHFVSNLFLYRPLLKLLKSHNIIH